MKMLFHLGFYKKYEEETDTLYLRLDKTKENSKRLREVAEWLRKIQYFSTT
jgi:hypothetical protein